jgi:hypothetical protein
MDKKKQFQIQNLTSKLQSYKDSLSGYQQSYDTLKASLNTVNPNSDNIEKLLNKKIDLEKSLENIKLLINNTSILIKNNKQEISQQPIIQSAKLLEEEKILKDELNRIEFNKIDTQKENELLIEQAQIDKMTLFDNINFIKQQLQEQKQIVIDVQLQSHSSRKEILAQLHKKKQDKLLINSITDNSNKNHSDFDNKINSIKIILDNLEEFKKLVVDSEYNIDHNIAKLTLYYTEFNIDNNLSINDQIQVINQLIQNNTNMLAQLNKKYLKTKNNNIAIINNITEKYNTTNKTKVLGYKDKFKIEKEKQQYIQSELNNQINKYDTYDDIIIGKIKSDLMDKYDEYDFDIKRATERLNIMKIRISEEYNNSISSLTNNNLQLVENLKTLRKQFDDTNIELTTLKKLIEIENASGIELHNINKNIIKYQNIITQTENDISDINKI